MAKTRKPKKTSRKAKEDFRAAGKWEKKKSSAERTSDSQIQRKGVLLQLAGNPHFVGAMRFMLRGCLACGAFFAILLFFPDFAKFFEQILYTIASPIPKNFIPPNTYLPGKLTPPILLLMIAALTIFGYKKGEAPPVIVPNEDDRSPTEKILEFVFLFAVCLVVVFFRFREDHPEYSLRATVSHPIFIGMLIIIILGIPFYVFSRHQSRQYLIFVMSSALAIGFVLFLLGLTAHAIIEASLYALSH